MTTQDLSRHLFQPEKHYASARMQQGRPILDSDFNEAEILDDEGQRVVMVDVVGPHGSSTPGFTIGEVSTDIYDFEILAGSYFLGGMRHEIADVDGDPQRFREQTDWLQAPRPGVAPTLPMAPRHDLVYLVGWEQTVSAVEDLELVEHALGGRDTTVRVRHMHRVLVREATAEDCSAAFDGLVAALRNSEAHTFDPRSNELRSGARLTVGLATIESSDDLCSEPGVTGYVGGENQAIRVQMIATNRFLWAYDNASPLFRVTASRVGGTATIVFVTPPQEQALFALKEQIVELLPWGAVLPNGEHVADHPISDSVGGGLYARVLTSYNPVTKTLTATVTNTTLFDAMLTWFDDHDVDGDQRIFFLRVWNGDDMPMMGHGYSTAGTVALPGTGLEVTITSPAIVGDYWILAARPATPEQVIPWDLMDGAAPHGPRRFYCPLGMLHWSLDGDDLQVTADSCRRPFRPADPPPRLLQRHRRRRRHQLRRLHQHPGRHRRAPARRAGQGLHPPGHLRGADRHQQPPPRPRDRGLRPAHLHPHAAWQRHVHRPHLHGVERRRHPPRLQARGHRPVRDHDARRAARAHHVVPADLAR
jgi:hypothetical protein